MSEHIYKITNSLTQDFYIGSTRRIDKRWKEHVDLAKRGRHHSIIFQRAWDKYGEEVFLFEVLEECFESNLLEREQYYITNLKPKYNICSVVGQPPPPANKPILRTCMVTGDEKKYNTRDDAAKDGFNEGEITACCLNRAGSHKGYFWQFVEDSDFENTVWQNTKKVKRIDSSKNIKIFNSVIEAAKDGSTSSGISACALGKQKTHNGYQWEYVDCPRNYIVSDRNTGRIKRTCIKTRGEYIYEKVSDVKKDGFSQGNVTSCCKGLRGSHKGYYWNYVDDPINFVSEFKKVTGVNIKTGEKKEYENRASVKKDGFSPQKVGACILGRRLSHKGYRWSEL